MSGIIKKFKSIQWQSFIIMALIAAVVIGSDGCKSSGKLTKKEKKAQIEAAKKQLNEIIAGTSTKSLTEQEQIVSEIANKHYNDAGLNQLLTEASQKLKKIHLEKEKIMNQRIDAARAVFLDMLVNKENKSADELEDQLNQEKAAVADLNNTELNELIVRVEKKIADMRSTSGTANIPLKNQLENAFQNIAKAAKSGNLTQAGTLIKNTLQLFTSDDAPVLIIVSRQGSIVDYDKPTTIKRYLYLIQDQAASKNDVDSYQQDTNGKIKELDLIKK
jgi:hypothetical protein